MTSVIQIGSDRRHGPREEKELAVPDRTEERNEDRRAMRADFVRMLDSLLDQRGLSQRRFVADVGLSSHTEITRWKTLAYEPRPETVFEIEEYFRIPPGSLSRTLGYLPVNARQLPTYDDDYEAMVEAHSVLPKWGKEILLTAYREIIGSLGRRRSNRA